MSDPARILEVSPDGAEATVWLRGAERRLSLAALTLDGQHMAPGDWVLASAGLAVEPMDEDAAHELLAFLNGQEPS